MSTLTDSDDARRECCRTAADTSAATVARLTRERDEARAALLTAVERVLTLHSPRTEAVLSDPDCMDEECDHEDACPLTGTVTVCAACWIVAEEAYPYFCEQGIPDEVLHPCPTVRAITEALA